MSEPGFNVTAIQACVSCVVSLEKALTNRLLANASNEIPELTGGVATKLRKLHKLIVSDSEHCDIAVTLIRANFFSTISFSATTILKFTSLTDEVLRVILPLIRLPPDTRKSVITQLLSNGGIIFALLALKKHMQKSSSVRVQALELLSTILEHVAKVEEEESGKQQQQATANRTTGNKHPMLPQSSQRSTIQDAVHQLLLHGAASTLCRLLTLSVSNQHEISVRRAVSCLTILVLETPPDLATKLASYENWSVIKALHTVLREMSLSARVDAAALLTGLLASDMLVAERIHSLGVWDELSSTLAQNASVIKVPKHWLKDSLEKIRLVNDNTTGGATASSSTPFSPGGRTNFFDMATVTRRSEPAFEINFESGAGFEGINFDDNTSMISDKANFESVVNALLDTHAAVDTGPKRHPLGLLSNAHLEAQLQRHMAKAKESFSGFDGMQDVYYPQKTAAIRPKSASAAVVARKKKDTTTQQEKNYIRHLKTSPLGHPIDPAQYRKEMREHGGQLPEFVPPSLGGKALGRRPGAPRDPNEIKLSRPSSSRAAAVADYLPLPAAVTMPGPKKSKKKMSNKAAAAVSTSHEAFPSTVPVASSANVEAPSLAHSKNSTFVAQRLFNDDGVSARPAAAANTSAIDKLSFAERLQCMILQVKEKLE
jgi:hypothetical protein